MAHVPHQQGTLSHRANMEVWCPHAHVPAPFGQEQGREGHLQTKCREEAYCPSHSCTVCPSMQKVGIKELGGENCDTADNSYPVMEAFVLTETCAVFTLNDNGAEAMGEPENSEISFGPRKYRKMLIFRHLFEITCLDAQAERTRRCVSTEFNPCLTCR